MHDSKGKILLTLSALFTLAWVSAWLAGMYIDPSNWPLRYRLFGIGFVLAAGCLALWAHHLAEEHRLVRRFFEMLGQLEPRDLKPGHTLAVLPRLSKQSPWHGTARQLIAAQESMAERLEAAEHSRAALEVRVQSISARHEQVESILDSLAEPVVAIDDFDELVLANPSAARLFDLDPQNTGHRAVAQLLHCEQLLDLMTDTRRRKTATQRTGEVELTDHSGQTRCFSVTARGIPIRGAAAPENEGTAQGAVAVLRDISGLKASQRRNAQFVSAVSHEMRTPLAGIKAYLELLLDGDAEDEATRDEFLNVISSQADRLQRLVDNLLNLARIEAGVVHVTKETRSLNDLLDEAFNIVRPAADAKQIKLANYPSNLYLSVLVDRDLMIQAAINLLSNAIKYTPDGGSVTLRSRLIGDQAQFEIEDTGVGLSEEDQVRVFEKFYRVKKDRDMAVGTGLGLPLAKHIVEDVHGGKLTLESVLERGSTFRVTLPAAGKRT